MFKLAKGTIEVHILSAGLVHVDSGGPFGLVPRALWKRYQKPDEKHMLPMCLNCLLLKTAGKNILVDVGMGNKLDAKMRSRWQLSHPHGTLLEGIGRLGLQAEDIDMVINTHLHGDHCEMNTCINEDGQLVATFPKAEHVVQKREYEDAMHPNERTRATYVPVNYEPLMQSGQLRLLEGDTEFFPGVKGVVTPGHTPGHMSVLIGTDDDYLFFTCDLASYAVHFLRLGWMTAYDVEPLVTLESKRFWQKWALETGAILVFPHDVTMLAARLKMTDSQQPNLVALSEDEGACYS